MLSGGQEGPPGRLPPGLTRYDIALRHNSGATTAIVPADGGIPLGTDPLFLIGPDGALAR
jgi:hypothetical protein